MGVTFDRTPELFGAVHLIIVAGIFAGCAGLYFLLRGKEERWLIRFIGIHGIVMLLTEAWKQWFVWAYVYEGEVSTWFFPWQLCSMSMYVSALVPLVKGKARDACLAFLATFGVIGGVMALAFPADMMRPQILLFVHSFWYHGAMLAESLAAGLVLRRRREARYLPAVWMFLGMALAAEVINVVSFQLIQDTGRSANMFNITPYYPSTQPVFHEIALAVGIGPEIVIYLGCIVLGGFLLWKAQRAGLANSFDKRNRRSEK